MRCFLLIQACLLIAACEPENPRCEARLPKAAPGEPSVDFAWCPRTPLTLVVDETAECDLASVQAAIEMWGSAAAADDVTVTRGERPAEGEEHYAHVYLGVGDVPGVAIGDTRRIHVGPAMDAARVTVERCELQILTHELGHAFGLGHADDVASIMHATLEAESWDMPRAAPIGQQQ